MGGVCGPMNRDALFTATPTRGEADAYIRGVKAACGALGVPRYGMPGSRSCAPSIDRA